MGITKGNSASCQTENLYLGFYQAQPQRFHWQLRLFKNDTLNSKIILIRSWLAVLLLFSIPISTSLTGIVSVLYIFSLCASCNLKELFYFIKTPLILSCLLFILITGISAFYSPATNSEIFTALRKVSRFLLLLILMPSFKDKEWQNRGIAAFILGVLILLITNLYAHLYTSYLYPSYHFEFFQIRDRILTSIFVALSIFLMGLILFYKKNSTALKYALFISILISSYYLFFENEGRSGLLIFLLLLPALFFRNFNKNLLIVLPILICSACILAAATFDFLWPSVQAPVENNQVLIMDRNDINQKHYIYLPTMLIRFKGIFKNTQEYFSEWSKDWKHPPILSSKSYKSYNSGRLEYYSRTFLLCLQHPFFGHGAGSFAKIYNQNYPEHLYEGEPLKNPHSQYLLIFFEQGILGLIALLLIFASILYYYFTSQDKFESLALLGIFYVIFIGNILNSWFLDFSSAHFLICVLALFAGRIIYTKPYFRRG